MKYKFDDQGVFQKIIMQLDASVVITDTRGNIEYVNPFFEENTGYSFAEVKGQNPRILKSGNQSKEVYTRLWDTINAGETWTGEFQNKRKDGSLFWEKVTINPVYGDSDAIESFVAVKMDITKEKEEAEVARRRENLLNEIQELSLTGGWEYDIKSEQMYWTDQMYELLQRDKFEDKEHFEDVLSAFHPQDMEVILAAFNELYNKGKEYNLKARLTDSKGNNKWVRTKSQAIKDDAGTIVKLIGSVKDITESVMVEEKLKQSEQTYKMLFEQSSDPKLIETDGIFTACNKATLQALGFTDEAELVGKTVSELSPELQANGFDSSSFWQTIINTLRTEGFYKCEWNFLDKDENSVPFEMVVTKIKAEDGRDINYVVLRDISKRKLIETDLRNAYQERGVLLAEIHHRVKNNLAVISGLIQLQLMHAKSPDLYHMLRKSVNRINSIALIHEQLYKSNNFSDVHLADNIITQLKSVENMFSDHFTAEIDHDLCLEEVSVGINQALPIGLLINEIITNSFKYAFKNRSEGKIVIALAEKNGDIHLDIGDDGVGMNEDEFLSHNSLGQKLIETLLAQLEAEYSIDFKEGLMYRIRFPREQSQNFA